MACPCNIIKNFGDQDVYDRKVSRIACPRFCTLGRWVSKCCGWSITKFRKYWANPFNLNAVRTAGVAYNTFKNVNFTDIIQSEITRGLTSVLQSGDNPE